MKPLNQSFQNCKLFQNRLNRYQEIGTRKEHIYVICCRLEVDGDVISGANIKTIECYALLNFEAASISSFHENQNQSFA